MLGGLKHLPAAFKGSAISWGSIWYPSLALLVLSSCVGVSNTHLLPISQIDAVTKGSGVFLQWDSARGSFQMCPTRCIAVLVGKFSFEA